MAWSPERWQRASMLLDELLELQPGARASRLAEIAAEDPALADDVRAMLDHDARTGGVLDQGVAGIAPTVVEQRSGSSSAAHELPAGALVSHYKVIRLLGRGGMGEVYLALRSDGGFDQQVALKLLKRGMDSEQLVRRFVQERRILAGLGHPRIARFIDGGIAADGRLYYAMEYVDGTPIGDYAQARKLDVRERVQLIAAVCEAVAHAQTQLVVHRDLKPSNILIDRDGQPRVLDFGIAKLLGSEDEEAALTATGARALSPAYAAPEQVLAESISTATDVYALGVILFELLTGELPHQRKGVSLETLAEQVRRESPERPSAVLRKSQADSRTTTSMLSSRAAREIAGDLDTVVLTALRREPRRRYATAAALGDDLNRWLQARPVAAQPDTAGYRLRKFAVRNRLAVGSAGAVLLALLAGLSIALWQASIARQQAARAHAEAARAEREAAAALEAADRTRRVKEFMMQTFVQADPLRQDADAPKTVPEAFDDALKRIDADLGDDPKLQIDLLDDFSEVRAGQGRFDEARTLVERALALAEQTYGRDHPVVAESLVNRSVISNYAGDQTDEIIADLERAIAILEKVADSEPLNLANALSALSAVRDGTGRSQEALALTQRSLALWRQHGKPNQDGLAVALHNNATALLNLGRFTEAEPLEREAIDELVRIGGPDTPRLEPTFDTLAQILYRQGKKEQAIAINLRRLALVQKAFTGPHPWTASVLADLGQQQSSEHPDQAVVTLDQSIAMFEQLDTPRILMPLRYRALLERDRSGDAGAIAYFDRALDVCRQRKLDHLMCDVVRANRAGMVARLGDGDTALKEVEAAMASMLAKNAGDDNEYAQALESKASALAALGRQDEAEATQLDALARYVKLFGEQHDEVVRARRNLDKLRTKRH